MGYAAAAPVPQKFYRPRDHAASPFFKLVRGHFAEFERVYADWFQEKYGFWRSVIGTAIPEVSEVRRPKRGLCPSSLSRLQRGVLRRFFVSPAIVLSLLRPEAGAHVSSLYRTRANIKFEQSFGPSDCSTSGNLCRRFIDQPRRQASTIRAFGMQFHE